MKGITRCPARKNPSSLRIKKPKTIKQASLPPIQTSYFFRNLPHGARVIETLAKLLHIQTIPFLSAQTVKNRTFHTK